MVTRGELALAIINWVALFIPALAIMLNTFSKIYEGSLLEIVGVADARMQQVLSFSIIAFAATFSALVLSLLYLLMTINPFAESLILGGTLVIAVISIFVAIGITTLILIDFFRAGSAISIKTGKLEEIAESNPELAIEMLNAASQMKQIDQQEIELIADSINLSEKLERHQENPPNSE